MGPIELPSTNPVNIVQRYANIFLQDILIGVYSLLTGILLGYVYKINKIDTVILKTFLMVCFPPLCLLLMVLPHSTYHIN